MVAELNPWVLAEHGCVTIRCTVDMYNWVEESSNIMVRRESVLSHKGFLWWFDLSYWISIS
jgi:hypothetical protein